MAEREWSKKRARAWLLRKAAEMVERGGSGAAVSEVLIKVADAYSAMLCDEHGFAQLLKLALSMGREDIARAVAEVYGEAPAPTPLRPAADVALEMVSDPTPCLGGLFLKVRDGERAVEVVVDFPSGAETLRLILEDAIDRSRAEGAAAAQARIAQLEAAVATAQTRLFDAAAAYNLGDESAAVQLIWQAEEAIRWIRTGASRRDAAAEAPR